MLQAWLFLFRNLGQDVICQTEMKDAEIFQFPAARDQTMSTVWGHFAYQALVLNVQILQPWVVLRQNVKQSVIEGNVQPAEIDVGELAEWMCVVSKTTEEKFELHNKFHAIIEEWILPCKTNGQRCQLSLPVLGKAVQCLQTTHTFKIKPAMHRVIINN